jgi:O-antigen ligase
VHSAYLNRVLAGLTTSVRQVDYSTIYRLEEVRLLKLSITGNEFFGNGFGYRYRLQGARGAFGSHTYYAHHFYWWAVAKVGWLGLIGYMIPFLAGVVNAIFGPGRFALRTAAGAAAVGCMTIMTVAPLPEDAFGAPAFGALLGIALLHAPYPNEGFSSTPSSLAQNAKAPLGQRA